MTALPGLLEALLNGFPKFHNKYGKRRCVDLRVSLVE